MTEIFQNMVHDKLIMGIMSLVFGVVLVVWQAGAIAEIIRILGILLLIGSAVALLTYFLGRENKGNPSTLATAILGIIVGLIFAYVPEWLIAFFPVVMGIILIVNGILDISMLASSPARTAAFPLGIVLAIFTLILGLVSLFQPLAVADAIVLVIGIAFLVNGVGDLVAVSMMR